MEYKKCSRCRELKRIDQYNKNRAMKDGLDHYCRLCRSVAAHECYVRNRERCIQSSENWRRKNPDYMKEWLQQHPGYMEERKR